MGLKELKNLSLHDPYYISNHCVSNFVCGHYPKEELKKILPKNMSIPSDEVMAKEYPTAKPTKGMHPFLMIYSQVFDLCDVASGINWTPYREIYFYIPTIYTHNNGEEHLCSYGPVLYLDTLMGVIGGLLLGMRKQFHPKMKYDQTDTSNYYIIKDFLNVSCHKTTTESSTELDPFFDKIFKVPMLTYSYFKKVNFHSVYLSAKKVIDTSTIYSWNYKGNVIKNNENTFSCYNETRWSLSRAISYEKYFHPTYPVAERVC